MTGTAFSDDASGEPVDARLADPQEMLADDGDAVDELLDTSYSPPERPVRNVFEHESLTERLADEEPEVWAAPDPGDGIGDATDTDGEPYDDEVGQSRAGRLVAPSEGAHSDTAAELWATDVGIDGGAASAEEAAIHVITPFDD